MRELALLIALCITSKKMYSLLNKNSFRLEPSWIGIVATLISFKTYPLIKKFSLRKRLR